MNALATDIADICMHFQFWLYFWVQHLPSSFDSTEEWLQVKDFLWLLGYPYRPIQIVGRVDGEAAEDGVDDATASVWDKRYCLYRLARVMDRVQELFTALPGCDDVLVPAPEEKSSSPAFVATMHSVACHTNTSKVVGSAAAICENSMLAWRFNILLNFLLNIL